MSIETYKAAQNLIDRVKNWNDSERAQLFISIQSSYCWKCGKEKHIGASLGVPNCEHDLDPFGAVEIESLRDRIAILESALGLPEGCDPWDLERAKVEGARPRLGSVYKFLEMADKKSHLKGYAVFGLEGGISQIYVNPNNGAFFGHGNRLYCIKKGSV